VPFYGFSEDAIASRRPRVRPRLASISHLTIDDAFWRAKPTALMFGDSDGTPCDSAVTFANCSVRENRSEKMSDRAFDS